MQGQARLESCRRTLLAIREQQTDVMQIKHLRGQTDEERGAILLQLDRSRNVLRSLRLMWPERMAMAMQVLDGLDGMERSVLWQYYVLGMSGREIALEKHYAYKSVMRIKRRALDRLGELAEDTSDKNVEGENT